MRGAEFHVNTRRDSTTRMLSIPYILHVHDSIVVCSSNRQHAMVSVMFVHLTIGGGPVGLVLVFAASPKEMALRSVSFSSGLCRYA